jgi:hypothetical protein
MATDVRSHSRGKVRALLLLGATVTAAVVLAACGSREPQADRRPQEAPRGDVAGVMSTPEGAHADREHAGAQHEAAEAIATAPAASTMTASAAVQPTRTPRATPTPDAPKELLPDLQVLPTRELYIEGAGDARKLRFSTTVVNTGDGPLDIAGAFDAARRITTATQLVHHDDGSAEEHLAGEFAFHPGHEHWHFRDFTAFELWTYREDGSLDEMKASTGKATFCAVDEVLEHADLPRVPQGPSYLQCGQAVQGISVGWSDTYTADLIGQELDISGVPDGRYAVRTIVDPAERLRETRDDNNEGVVYVELHGDRVSMLDGP